MPKNPRVAIVGATGAVGQTILSILEERHFSLDSLRLFASARSAGNAVVFRGETLVVEDLETADIQNIDIALFSAGASVSKVFAPRFAEAGAVVIDNTSAFRNEPDIPLVVPEVNREAMFAHQGIIANPNCSTIQMLVALKPLHDAAGLKRIIVSTYQAVSGAGSRARQEMLDSTRAALDGHAFDYQKFVHPIAFNALPHIDVFLEGGWTKEEMKMVWETRKIMDLPEVGVTATCVRIPVASGHSESVYAEFDRPLSVTEAHSLWRKAPGIEVVDDPAENRYPMVTQAVGTDPVYVGRTRVDLSNPHALNFWCVSDNLRKGAALNAVQIAEELLKGPAH